MYNYDALWLTQWNVNSVLGLGYPEVLSSFVRSQLQMYRDGGLLPRGPVAGNDSLIMTGSPVTSFIAGAFNKGIRDFDVETAYDAMLERTRSAACSTRVRWSTTAGPAPAASATTSTAATCPTGPVPGSTAAPG